MPLKLPPFNQYQSPIVPLRGLWNAAPVEGDKFVSAEIDWLVTTTQQAVQFALSGNSPVAMSQIVALAVDNSRCGADVQFVFSDSGFVLAVPSHEQLVAPVFTNGLMFYVVANAAVVGDVTAFSVLNSMPPTIMIAPSVEQNHAVLTGATLADGTNVLIPPPISGTLNTLSIAINQGGTAGLAELQLIDGTGTVVWATIVEVQASSNSIPINVTGMSVRFSGGLSLVVSGSTLTGGVVANAYYSTP